MIQGASNSRKEFFLILWPAPSRSDDCGIQSMTYYHLLFFFRVPQRQKTERETDLNDCQGPKCLTGACHAEDPAPFAIFRSI